MKFGRQACDLSAIRVNEALQAVVRGVHQAAKEMATYAETHPDFAPVAEKIMAAWESGLNVSCRPEDQPLFMLPDISPSDINHDAANKPVA